MDRIVVGEDDFDPGSELEALRIGAAGEAGAIASFIGTVRSDDGVATLELEHYPGMTERSIEAIVHEAHERFDLAGMTVIHRVGRLEPGARIVFVAAASAHRASAFEATEFVMDYLKTRAVFWKRETLPDGTRWVESSGADHAAAQAWDDRGSP